MFVVPAATPVATPVALLIEATLVVPLAQVPPLVASLSTAVLPTHTVPLPVIDPGSGFTVTSLVAVQPDDVTV